MDLKIEVLNAISAQNPILNEKLRLLLESLEMLIFQQIEVHRLGALTEDNELGGHTSTIDQKTDGVLILIFFKDRPSDRSSLIHETA
jgi:hypothetical protein